MPWAGLAGYAGRGHCIEEGMVNGMRFLLLALLPLVGKVPISYSVRNLLVRWKITLMTMTAFTAITALLTVMLAFVNGMYRLTAGSA